MRRNKRIKKRSRFATSSMGVASLIVSAFIMMMIYFAMNSKCSSITREIGKKEKELQRLEAELTREKTRWDEMKVPERLKTALTRFGLEMDVPREDQLVRMNSSGKPVPGQLALARLRASQPQQPQILAARTALVSPMSRTKPRRMMASTQSIARRSTKNGVRK